MLTPVDMDTTSIKQYNPTEFDSSKFDINPFSLSIEKEWGTETTWTKEGAPYVGKQLNIHSGGVIESTSDRFRVFFFRDGDANIEVADDNGEMQALNLDKGVGYRIQPGQKYRLTAKSDSSIVEASMPNPDSGNESKQSFEITPCVRRVEKPWGYELHWAKESDPLMAKILHVDEGEMLSEQVHDTKEETYWIVGGNGKVQWDNEHLELIDTPMVQGEGYRTYVGQRHRLCGLEGGVDILEVSTPEEGTTWRLKDKYARPDETPDQRKKERGEQ